ncbi:hypothetical protein JYU34_001802 [Plutella xylostella]|uniref:Sperm microtubule inner protein 1 C-terminal domain-containing protein n=1 Tax=Plutella xylostella TaxID=51655 RepID=A0ABQ7R4U1_PLUXY|nr:uncharacterized protein LOC125488990 [Plutella xylostella]KAG7312321.1 hypothetical protein JYU34_001802 [Plutella xylostella]
MPLPDINDPKIGRFLVENYEKENKKRLVWIMKHKDAMEEAAVLHRTPTNYYESDVSAHLMKAGMTAITRDFISSGKNRFKKPSNEEGIITTTKDLKHGHTLVDVGLGDPNEDPRLSRPDTDTSPDPIMRPVDPETTEIIHKSRPEFGREVYLKERARIWPENRYYFPECTSFDYGWRMKDSAPPEVYPFGRTAVMKQDMESRVGPQPDPPHYQSPEFQAAEKCSWL